MADVTISQLTQGTPSGSASIPFSENNSTNQIALSSLYSNTVLSTPAQPSFMVQANGSAPSVTHPGGASVRLQLFSIKLFETGGNNYDTTQSRYTVPTSGVYSFSGMLRLNPSPNGWMYPYLYVNGQQYGNGVIPGLTQINSSGNSGGFGTANFHCLMQLNKGDYVDYYFGIGNSGTFSVDGQSVWYGYLLG